jgi:Cdc6-like AAA superfamily ATPase
MDPIRNPYNPGAGTRPPAFMGRQDLLREFEVALGRTLAGRPGKSLMPIGLRGVGKTVLLNCFVDIAAQQKCRVAYIEASEAGNFSQILVVQLRKVLGELDRFGAASVALKKLSEHGEVLASQFRLKGRHHCLSGAIRCAERRIPASFQKISRMYSSLWARLQVNG